MIASRYTYVGLREDKPNAPGCCNGRLEHDGSPVARWCIGNVVGHYDRRRDIYPNRARKEAKIDCAIATIMALGASIASEAPLDDLICKDHRMLVL